MPGLGTKQMSAGSRSASAAELRSKPAGASAANLERSSSLAAMLPPIELRGIRALPVSSIGQNLGDSQSSTKEFVSLSGRVKYSAATVGVAHVAANTVLSPSRSHRASSHSDDGQNSSGDDVSQFTASSCGSVRGHGYQKSDSSKSSARGPIIGGHKSRRKRKQEHEESLGGVCCPRGHELVFSERHKPWFCHGCGRVSSTCEMECFRCNRCNYNLCDQCWQAQQEDVDPPPPFWPSGGRPQSGGGTSVAASLPQSIDELLTRSNDDRTLPPIPPGFSRGLSPSPEFSPRLSIANSTCSNFRAVGSAASTGASWMSISGTLSKKKSKSPSPTRWNDVSPSQTHQSQTSRHSSSSSMARAMASPRDSADPMLRIVCLSEWIAKSGLFSETLADYALASTAEGQRSAVQGLADVMVQGMSYGQSGSAATRSRLNKAALERLSQMHRTGMSGTLPLEDVHEDLKIWHLTLMRRPIRKMKVLEYGRVIKRPEDPFVPDADFLQRAQLAMDGDVSPSGARRGPGHGAGGGDFQSSYSGDYQPGQPGYSGSGGVGGGAGGGVGGYSSSGGYNNPNDPGYVPGAQQRGERFDSDFSGERDQNGNLKPGGGRRRSGGVGPDGKPLEVGPDGEPLYDEDGQPARRRSDKGIDEPEEGDASKPGTAGADGQPGAAEGESGAEGDDGKPGAAGKKDHRLGQQSASKSTTPKAGKRLDGSPDSFANASDAVDAEPEPTEEELLMAAGLIFRVKKVAEQAILDEFAIICGLLPPPPLASARSPSKGKRSRPGTEESSRARKKAPQKSPNLNAGTKSSLSVDFTKVIVDAFRLIDFPDEAKNRMSDTEADVEAFLKELDAQDLSLGNDLGLNDPGLNLMSSSGNVQVTNAKNETSALETHLRMRAERHGKRLKSRGEKVVHGHGHEDLWHRRLQGCRQSFGLITPLDHFAESRARRSVTA